MDKVERFVEGMNFEHISASVRRRHPKITWTKMAEMRDKLIHGYFGLDLEIVWETATRFVPEHRPLIAQVLREEFLPRE